MLFSNLFLPALGATMRAAGTTRIYWDRDVRCRYPFYPLHCGLDGSDIYPIRAANV